MSSFLDRVAGYIRANRLLDGREAVLVGVSGGPDSMVLANALHALGHPIEVAHLNHQLRGRAADLDEELVRRWCAARDIRFHVQAVDTAEAASLGDASIQEAGRELRYQLFLRTARSIGVNKVAVGHHRDDHAETVLLNLFRGTGPEGLAGIPPARELEGGIFVVRPLLFATRDEVLAFAMTNEIAWRDDDSNRKTLYRRGALRSEIIPLIEHFFGPVRENIARSGDLVRRYVETIVRSEIEEAFERAAELDGDTKALNVAALLQEPEIVRTRVILEAVRKWLPDAEASMQLTDEIVALAASQPGRRKQYGNAEVWRDRERLVFLPAGKSSEPELADLPLGGAVELRTGTVACRMLADRPATLDSGSPCVVFAAADALRFPLRVRTWRAGDVFTPLGMKQSKKLSDFLTDARTPPHEKGDVLVVESEGKIVWVVGYRLAEEARVSDATEGIIELRFEPRQNHTHRPAL